MVFFFEAVPVHLLDPVSNAVIARGSRADIVGPGTRYNGKMMFNGRYSFLSVDFRAGGFYRLFRVPCSQLTNRIVSAADVLGPSVDLLYEQLNTTPGLAAKGTFVDAFLFGHLLNHLPLPGHKDLSSIPSRMHRDGHGMNVDRMAHELSMSVRNFERRFVEQVGIPPKLYGCVERFNRALSLKIRYPERGWASVAADCGYFDQMHMVKDFNRFAGSSPADFLRDTPLSTEIFTSRVEG